ncbi:MAG: fibrobacter succinogenes major paralogous domain-containing protein [Flavobacteriaceae bacterium]
MKKLPKLLVLVLLTLFFSQCSETVDTLIDIAPEAITVTDADGNTYRTITIGSQVWMLENLKTTKFNDGTPITEYLSGEHWNKENRTFPFYQWASTDDLNNVIDGDLPEDYYGMMYNHAAIESGKLAPEGWRIPTEQDWRILKNYIANDGYLGSEGDALKSSSGWSDHSGNGIDAYEFKGLPNGYVDSNGTPKANTLICTWATSDHNSSQFTRKVINLFDQSEILFFDQSILLGAGVRCIKE